MGWYHISHIRYQPLRVCLLRMHSCSACGAPSATCSTQSSQQHLTPTTMNGCWQWVLPQRVFEAVRLDPPGKFDLWKLAGERAKGHVVIVQVKPLSDRPRHFWRGRRPEQLEIEASRARRRLQKRTAPGLPASERAHLRNETESDESSQMVSHNGVSRLSSSGASTSSLSDAGGPDPHDPKPPEPLERRGRKVAEAWVQAFVPGRGVHGLQATGDVRYSLEHVPTRHC